MCNNNKRTPHKHAELIKAWADGAEIEVETKNGWCDVTKHHPTWSVELTYRIKPEPSDLDKYGVEVGDVWTLQSTKNHNSVKYFVKYEPVKYLKICLLNLETGCGYSASANEFCDLIFRRGVVNKL